MRVGTNTPGAAGSVIGAEALAEAAWAACRHRLMPAEPGVRLYWQGRAVGRCSRATAAALAAQRARPVSRESRPALALAGSTWAEAMEIAARALFRSGHAAAGPQASDGPAERIHVLDDAGCPLPAAPRGLAVPLGLRMAGVHLTGLVLTGGPGGPARTLLLARRDARHASHPGQLDTLAGGVRRDGERSSACLRREAWEEAGLSAAALRGVRTFGAVSFDLAVPGGYARGRAVLADLRLPPGCRPRPLDGTVGAFHAVSVAPGAGPGREGAMPGFKPTAALATVASLQRGPARAVFPTGWVARILAAADFRAWPPRPLAWHA